MSFYTDSDIRALRRTLQTLGHEVGDDAIDVLLSAAIDHQILISINEAKVRYGEIGQEKELDKAFQAGLRRGEDDGYDKGWEDALDAIDLLEESSNNNEPSGSESE